MYKSKYFRERVSHYRKRIEEQVTPAHKRSRASIRLKMVKAIAAAHPDWSEAKVLAELTKAEMGIGEFASLRDRLSMG